MSKRDWLEIRLRIDGKAADTVAEIMEQLGSLAVTWQDAEDSPILEPKPGERRLWPNTEVTGLFDKNADATQIVKILSSILGDNIPIAIIDLEDQDWVRSWMDSFKPIRCADNLWICPSWCEIPDKNAANVMLDPGLAFGTGTHPTTFLCLEHLASLNLKDQEIIDYGCGSGILAIAALKLGAKKAYGIDIDEQAIIASKDNAQRNGVVERLELFNSTHTKCHKQTQFVIANILAGPLTELESEIATLCLSGGNLALSGILDEQAQEVIDAYSKDFTLQKRKVKEGWVLLVFTRK